MLRPHQYPLERSPLFRLRSKAKLANLLHFSVSELVSLSENPTYNVFLTSDKGKKIRQIEKPIGQLELVHKRVQNLLSRIVAPSYLYSGKKNLSYIDNAKSHLQSGFFLSLDIQSYYPNSKIEYVFRFFHYKMLMSEDMAWLISKLLTYDGHIPTGSQLSQSIADWAYSTLFDRIHKLADSKGFLFSLYVDDITFSSSTSIPRSFQSNVESEIRSFKLSIKETKVKRGAKKHFKVVTGCAITPLKEIAAPNRLRKKINDTMTKYPSINLIPAREMLSFIGQIEAARLIEPKFFDAVYGKLKTLRPAIPVKRFRKHRK